MSAFVVEGVGVAAGLCSMTSFIPQIAKILRERNAETVSRRMYLVSVVGFSLWIAYGVFKQSWPLMLSNLINLGLVSTILVLKLRWPGETSSPPASRPGG